MPQVGELSVLFTGNDAKLTAVTAHAQRSLSRFAGQARGILATAGLALSFAGATAAVRSFVNAAAEQEVAERKLSTALGRTSQALLDQASALQKTTTASDEQIVMAQASIAAFTKNEDRIKALTRAALDFASATGGDVVSAGQLLAKTLGSDMNALGRYGISIKGAANSTERFEQIINGVARLFGGQATSATTTFSGRVSVLKNRFGEVAEELGRKLIPSLEKLIVKLSENADAIGEMAVKLLDGTISWGAYAAAAATAGTILNGLGIKVVKTDKSLLALAGTTAGMVVIALASIAIGVQGVIAYMKDGAHWTDRFVDALAKLRESNVDPLKGLADAIHAVNIQLIEARKALADAKGPQEQLMIQEKIAALTEKGLALSKQYGEAQSRTTKDGKVLADDAEKAAKWEAMAAKAKEKQADLAKQVSTSKSPVAMAPGLGPLNDKITTGLTGARNAVKKLFDQMVKGTKEFLDSRADLLGKVRMFGVEGLDAAIENIKQQRDELMKEAAKLGLLPQVSGQINAAAGKQIDKARRDANQAFEDRVGGFGGNEDQQNQQAVQQIIRERDAIIEEAEGLGRLTDELRAQVNARAEQAAADAIKPGKTPEMVGLSEAFGRMQKSIFESEAQKEALMLAKAQLKRADDAAKAREELVKQGVKSNEIAAQIYQSLRSMGGVFGA